MKRLFGILSLGLAALSMVVVSSAVPGGRSAHALGAASSGQTAQLFVGGADSVTTVHRYEVGITGSNTFDLLLADSSFTMPGFLAVSPAGELFVVNIKGGRGHVSRFLNPLGGAPVFNGTFAHDLVSPHWATFRGDELFISDPGQSKVVRFIFDASGNAVPNGAINTGFGSGIRGVQVNSNTGELFVTICCGTGAHTIRRFLFDAAGNAIPNGGITHGGMISPHGLAFSPWGELFVANAGSNSVSRFVFDAAGNASPSPQGLIQEPPLSGPIGLTFSPWGELFVANRNTGTISRFGFDGSFNASLNGSFLNRPGMASRMHDLLFVTNQPPTADAGLDQTVECAGPGGTSVTLDGTMSDDPDHEALSFFWEVEGVNLLDPTIPMPTVTLPVGMTTATLTVTDPSGASDTDEVIITVEDTTAPTINSMSASPDALWVPNHKMNGVTVSVNVSDVCDSSISSSACEIVSVSSNEPINGTGDGDTAPDWQITGSLTVDLRAERAGSGNGRIYTIIVECTDASGNISTSTVAVSVPHSKGK